MEWKIQENTFCKERIELLGSKFCIGNGYFGYRETLDEYGPKQLAACTLSEIFDDNGCGWREPINVPNSLFSRVFYQGKALSVLNTEIKSHTQGLEFDCGLHTRKTTFMTEDGKEILVESERFASLSDYHLLLMRYRVTAVQEMEVCVITEIDSRIWDANGPHFSNQTTYESGDVTGVVLQTIQEHRKAAVAQNIRIIKGKAHVSAVGQAVEISVH